MSSLTLCLAWGTFFACAALAFYLLYNEPVDPDRYDRARDDSVTEDETDWERDYHARWNPREHLEDTEPGWGVRR